jgi:galactokinase
VSPHDRTFGPLHRLFEVPALVNRLAAAGMDPREAGAKAELFANAARVLSAGGKNDHRPAFALFVPGRIEVLGKHTDYCGGRSVLCTVARGMCFVALPEPHPQIAFHALELNETAALKMDPDLVPAAGHWSNYPMTVARRVARNFPGALTGAQIALASDLPPAAGLSSSSALIIGTFLVISALNNLTQRPEFIGNIKSSEDLAAYLGCCENGQTFGTLAGDCGVGTFGGSQDHTAILCSKPGRIVQYRFCPVHYEQDMPLPNDLTFVIAPSGVTAEKTGAALEQYNAISARARRLVELWNAAHSQRCTCLAHIVASRPDAADQLAAIITANAAPDEQLPLQLRLEQFVTESDHIIPHAADAIRRHDWAALGQLVDQSHQRAATHLNNQVDQTNRLQRMLRDAGAIAASGFGAGFGGSVWALVKSELAPAILERTGGFASRPSCAVTII